MDHSIILQAREEFTLAHRARGVVWELSDAHFVAVVDWIVTRVTFQRIEELCAQDLKLPPAKVPDFRRLSEFWQSFRSLLTQLHRRASAELARAAGDEARKSPVDWARSNADKIQQTTFELLHDLTADPDTVKGFVMASIKLNQQETDREKMRRELQDKIAAGLEALHAEISGNPQALAAWQQLKESLAA